VRYVQHAARFAIKNRGAYFLHSMRFLARTAHGYRPNSVGRGSSFARGANAIHVNLLGNCFFAQETLLERFQNEHAAFLLLVFPE